MTLDLPTPLSTTSATPSSGATVGVTPRPARGPTPRAGRLFSPAQLSILLGFSAVWVSKTFPRTHRKISELDVLQWLAEHRSDHRSPYWTVVTRWLFPRECAEYFGAGSPAAWRARMRTGIVRRCIISDAGDWRAPVEEVLRSLDG